MTTTTTTQTKTTYLAVGAALTWVVCLWFHLIYKSSLLDDAFIYLHIAGNVLDVRSAQFFPIADNPSLIASSPLHLVLLLPATIVARVMTDGPRSIETVRLSLVAYGLLACWLAQPLFRNTALWLAGTIFAGLICLSTESGLQMEALPLFWLLFALLTTMSRGEVARSVFVRVGLLVGLLVLARPEYGLPAFVLYFGFAVRHRRFEYLAAYLAPVVACAVIWIILAGLLHVYPLPTTFLTKIVTAKIGLFADGTFSDVVASRMRMFLWRGLDVPGVVTALFFVLVGAALATAGPPYSWAVFIPAAGFVLKLRSGGNYLWYHENLLVLILTICFHFLLLGRPQKMTRWTVVRSVTVALPLLLFFSNNLGRNRKMTWNFHAERSRGISYKATGESYVGGGMFWFEVADNCYLAMDEIGITSYFAGPGVWLLDDSGLAQAGTLPGARAHWLANLYPRRLLVHATDEERMIREKYGPRDHRPPLFFVYGNPDPSHVRALCDYYSPDVGICLREIGEEGGDDP